MFPKDPPKKTKWECEDKAREIVATKSSEILLFPAALGTFAQEDACRGIHATNAKLKEATPPHLLTFIPGSAPEL